MSRPHMMERTREPGYSNPPQTDDFLCTAAWAETVELTADLDRDTTEDLPGPDGAPLEPLATALGSPMPPGRSTPLAHAAMPAGSDRGGETSTLCARYVLERPLGAGGTAVISRARDLQPEHADGGDRYVAIKRLHPERRGRPGCVARLRREFHQTRSLAHPNIVRFHGLHCDQGTWFIAMEMLTGEALGDRMRRAESSGLPPGEALRIASACGAALEFAHAHGVTHGDVKPDNVFVTAADEVRVIDFGAAASLPQSESADEADCGQIAPSATRAYASPEVLAGQGPEPRDDVFSLSCVIYEMLSGHHPYERCGANEARDTGMQIKRLPGLDARQWRALTAGLAWRREQRPANVRELLRGVNTAAPRVVAPGSRRTWRRAAAAACVTGLAVLAGIVGFGLQDGARAGSSDPVPATAAGAAASVDRGAPLASAAMARAAPVIVPAAEVPVAAPTRPSAARVSFPEDSMSVSHRTVAVAIPVQRSTSVKRRTTAAWRLSDGTAVAGRDYGGPPTGVARFAEGQTVSVIYVPIMAGADAATDRTFSIDLTATAAGAVPAAPRRMVITIMGDG